MFLFFSQGNQDALAKRVRSVRELKQYQRHQLSGQQFVIGQEMQQLPTGLFVLQAFIAGGGRADTGRMLHFQIAWPSGSNE